MTVVRTSVTHPLRVDFIDDDRLDLPGRIGLTFAPGKKQSHGMSGAWDRQLDADLRQLREEFGTDLLVSLIEEHEFAHLQIESLREQVPAFGMETLWFPIRDLSVPESIEQSYEVVQTIVRHIRNGDTVVIHCMGGLGRTGLMAAACLVAALPYLSPEEAITIVRRARSGTLETPEQEAYITKFKEFLNSYSVSQVKEDRPKKKPIEDYEAKRGRHFMLYWRPETVDDNRYHRPLLTHAASNQLRRVSVGDTIWIVTVRDGELFVVGRLKVGEVTDWEGAKERLGTDNIWNARYHVIAAGGTAETISENSLGDIVTTLRFESPEKDRLTLSDSRVNPQQLQSMRVLTHDTAELLSEKWQRRPQIILRAGFEGEKVTVFGRHANEEGWEFWTECDSTTLQDMLSEEDAAGLSFYHQTSPVSTLKSALDMLGEWEWIMGIPITVHPEFREQVWEAVDDRSQRVPEQSRDWWSHIRSRWRAPCGLSPADGANTEQLEIRDEAIDAPTQKDWQDFLDDIQQLTKVANRYAVISAKRVAEESGAEYEPTLERFKKRYAAAAERVTAMANRLHFLGNNEDDTDDVLEERAVEDREWVVSPAKTRRIRRAERITIQELREDELINKVPEFLITRVNQIEEIERYRGSLLGLAIGDALGAAVEFKQPGQFSPLTTMIGGGTHNLNRGEWTDDTSMALCLADSLIKVRGFDPRDQMERYYRWWKEGYLGVNGRCFDIGVTIRDALTKFESTGDPFSGSTDPYSAGNGSLMRLAPVPLFYARDPQIAIEYSAQSGRTTHGAEEAVDACRYFGALMIGAVQGRPKGELLGSVFEIIPGMWDDEPLTQKILDIAEGSFKRDEPPRLSNMGGYVVPSLHIALWAFHKTDNFRDGALLAVNLGYDSDTYGAIYGQLAGAYYGESGIPGEWRESIVKWELITSLADQLFRLRPE